MNSLVSTPAIRRVAAKASRVSGLAVVPALLASAYLMALAMDSASYGWLGWVALLPLFHAIRVLTPLRASLAGAFWGASLFASAASLAAIEPGAWSLVVLSLVPSLYAGAGAWLTRRVGFSPYLLALGWVGVELALGPVGLKFGLLAATQGDGFAIRIVGSFAGYVFVAFLVAYFNAALLAALAEVVVAAKSSCTLRRGGSFLRRLIAQEAVIELQDLLRQAQPRGPPSPSFATVRCGR